MKDTIIHGALVIFYRGSRGADRRFLLVTPTPEVKEILWLTQEEVARAVTFPELTALFHQAIRHIPS